MRLEIAVQAAIKGVTAAVTCACYAHSPYHSARETHAFNVGVAELMKLSNTLRDCTAVAKHSPQYIGAIPLPSHPPHAPQRR